MCQSRADASRQVADSHDWRTNLNAGSLIASLRRLGVCYQGLDRAELPERIEADLRRFDMDTPVAGYLLELRERIQDNVFSACTAAATGNSGQIELTL